MKTVYFVENNRIVFTFKNYAHYIILVLLQVHEKSFTVLTIKTALTAPEEIELRKWCLLDKYTETHRTYIGQIYKNNNNLNFEDIRKHIPLDISSRTSTYEATTAVMRLDID